MPDSPFDLGDETPYLRWRERKLAEAPTSLSELVVEINDPRRLSAVEQDALLDRCRRANMAIYAGRSGDAPDKTIPTALGAAFGLHRLDRNRGADDDAVTSLTVHTGARHRDYIPYSNRPISWHTDGYYNSGDRQVCVRPAAAGGENLLDHVLHHRPISWRTDTDGYYNSGDRQVRALLLHCVRPAAAGGENEPRAPPRADRGRSRSGAERARGRAPYHSSPGSTSGTRRRAGSRRPGACRPCRAAAGPASGASSWPCCRPSSSSSSSASA